MKKNTLSPLKLAGVPKAPSIRRPPVEDPVVRITELEHEINTSIAQLNYSQDYIYHLHRKALALVRVPGV